MARQCAQLSDCQQEIEKTMTFIARWGLFGLVSTHIRRERGERERECEREREREREREAGQRIIIKKKQTSLLN